MITKFDIGQEVWIMNNNRPTKMKIVEILIRWNGSIEYNLNPQKRIEHEVFSTKEELIKSL